MWGWITYPLPFFWPNNQKPWGHRVVSTPTMVCLRCLRATPPHEVRPPSKAAALARQECTALVFPMTRKAAINPLELWASTYGFWICAVIDWEPLMFVLGIFNHWYKQNGLSFHTKSVGSRKASETCTNGKNHLLRVIEGLCEHVFWCMHCAILCLVGHHANQRHHAGEMTRTTPGPGGASSSFRRAGWNPNSAVFPKLYFCRVLDRVMIGS